MNRRLTLVTLALVAGVAFLVGLIMAGGLTPAPNAVVASRTTSPKPPARRPARPVAGAISFADVVDRINPAVVNIDATSLGARGGRRPPPFRGPGEGREQELPRRGAGSGFIIDAAGHILTNNHVIERADRLTAKLADGRSLPAQVVGVDPATDIALIKVEAANLPVAPLGDSDQVRVGEWVCAIGNPLAYEHSVTVGVVSFVGRKLWDTSLDNYIQTDAAINFGNSGGPLINAAGEVIGINAAISSRASGIGFAVPINQATEILAQLKASGRVARGYIGVRLKEVDQDLRRSLKLGQVAGALVEDVSPGSPGERVGIRTYDLIQEVDGVPVSTNDDLIRAVAARPPGSVVRLQVLRDGRAQAMSVKLAERPGRSAATDPAPTRSDDDGRAERVSIGLTVRPLDRQVMRRLGIPDRISGVLVSNVEALSPAYDSGIERGFVVMEINRAPVAGVDDYERITRAASSGDPLTFYVYVPGLNERALRIVRVE